MSSAIPNTYRFFIAPDTINNDVVTITDAALIHQLRRVLRLRPGNQVLMLDGQGTCYTVVLTEMGNTRIIGQIEQQQPAQGEPAITVTLYSGLLRADRFEWVLQKGTELGVSHFVPVQWSRSQSADQINERKLTRWEKIVREAAEQSGRGRLPEVRPPQPFERACQQAAHNDLALLLWEGAADKPAPRSLRAVLRLPGALRPAISVAILSGSEGGITAEELTTATGHGIIPVSLGPRILRAETAPIVASAALFYEFESDTADH